MIEDPQERLSAVIDRGGQLPGLSVDERVAANLVPGCVSAMYLVCTASDGRCFFRIDSGSALIKGLVGCLCTLYEGRTPDEILGDPDGLVAEMGLDRLITPNRLVGIGEVRKAMHRFARSMCAQRESGKEESK